ncbi:hypothetical protein SASPL_150415 [Salvia splendens]|uniref:Ubiquitin-specific protease family C19-related protein n=1 Tax=Salvia splendens TaxID=180675 RepID=A0A8X8Z2G1_SALSN|nr:hypothetical protein SASPL_150415 [Salvia splendens]
MEVEIYWGSSPPCLFADTGKRMQQVVSEPSILGGERRLESQQSDAGITENRRELESQQSDARWEKNMQLLRNIISSKPGGEVAAADKESSRVEEEDQQIGIQWKKLEAQCEGHWRRMDAKFDALKKAILYLSISSQVDGPGSDNLKSRDEGWDVQQTIATVEADSEPAVCLIAEICDDNKGEVSTMGVDSLVEQLSGVMEEEIVNDGLVEQLSGIVEEESIMLGKDAIDLGLGSSVFISEFEVLGLLLKPEQPKEKTPTMSSVAMPYTGGDIKKSGELGKMFDIPMDSSRSCKSGPINSAPTRSGSFGGVASPSGQLNSVRSGSVSAGGASGEVELLYLAKIRVLFLQFCRPLASLRSMKMHNASLINNLAVTHLSQDDEYSFRKSFPKPILWAIILLFVMGFIAGGFILGAVRNPVLLVVVVILFAAVASVFTWNTCWGRRAITSFIASYPDAELRTAKEGQFVKVSGLVLTSKPECCPSKFSFLLLKVVTCGNVPLESSFQRVPRCVYTSTSLYEYRGWDSKAANPTHRRFTWGLRTLERHVVDFYISDFQSGLRALVKTGYGARMVRRKKSFYYIKEGSTVSVMGVVQRNENVLMIVPPSEPFSTGCQWNKCILPASLEGIVLRCEDTSEVDVIPV